MSPSTPHCFLHRLLLLHTTNVPETKQFKNDKIVAELPQTPSNDEEKKQEQDRAKTVLSGEPAHVDPNECRQSQDAYAEGGGDKPGMFIQMLGRLQCDSLFSPVSLQSV